MPSFPRLFSLVSIHAPAWGATFDWWNSVYEDAVSIHAPAWGATNQVNNLHHRTLVSIHAPAWGATESNAKLKTLFPVSIHAPAWGATHPSQVNEWAEISFNPRPRMGGDEDHVIVLECRDKFQSTPPHGGRLTRPSPRRSGRGVSIHAPAWGATVMRRGKWLEPRVSIHAPAWGATISCHITRRKKKSFNPRPRMGGDHQKLKPLRPLKLFQSTPPHGGRHELHIGGSYVSSFNPRPRMGGDLIEDAVGDICKSVSIHAPAWGATIAISRGRWILWVSIHAPAWGATWSRRKENT